MKPCEKEYESSQAFGEALSTRRKPCFRASAAFVVLHREDLSTRVLFCNYWLIKRGIKEVNVLVSLRNEEGEVISRNSLMLTEAKSFAVYVSDLLKRVGRDPSEAFEGSIECEIFSTRDLVFPFPAVVLNYFTEECMAAVHTAGRIYNDVEDMTVNSQAAVPESGFDVIAERDTHPFFNFVNGPFAERDKRVKYEVVGEDNARDNGVIEIGAIAPYGSVHVDLQEVVRQMSTKRGTIKLFHDFRGFFPRFVAGNIDGASGSVSITHTYYDCTEASAPTDYWANEDADLIDSSVFVPVWADGDYYTEVVFYPIISPTQFRIDLEFFDMEGKRLSFIEGWKEVKSGSYGLFTANVKEVLQTACPDVDLRRVAGMKISKAWETGEAIPARLKFGLNVGIKGRKVDLPSNICFNSLVAYPELLNKPGCFRWTPILNHAESVIVINNSSFVKKGHGDATLELEIYRERDDTVLKREARVNENGQHRIVLSKDDELVAFLGGETGWMITRSNNPFVDTWYFEFSESGAIGGDHGF